MWHNENYCGGLSGLSMALFTRVLGMSPEELELFLVDVRKDMKDTKIHAYWPVYVYSQPSSLSGPGLTHNVTDMCFMRRSQSKR